METNYKELDEKVNSLLMEFGEKNPGIIKGFMQMHKTMDDEGALSPKIKELISLSIAVVVKCEGCVAHHMNKALDCGASHAEIVEAIGVSVCMGGGPALVYASIAVKALSDFDGK
jgi:AhpD family alkylhydroperoxidase